MLCVFLYVSSVFVLFCFVLFFSFFHFFYAAEKKKERREKGKDDLFSDGDSHVDELQEPLTQALKRAREDPDWDWELEYELEGDVVAHAMSQDIDDETMRSIANLAVWRQLRQLLGSASVSFNTEDWTRAVSVHLLSLHDFLNSFLSFRLACRIKPILSVS